MSSIKKRVVRDGVIRSVEATIDLASSEMPDIEELQKLTFFQTVEMRIAALQEHVQDALDSEGSRNQYAADAIRSFDMALKRLNKISDPAAKRAAEDVAWHLMDAAQSLWRTDVKEVEPEIVRGAKSVASGKEGHEAVHGTDEEKRRRWRQHIDAYRAARAAGESKKAAKLSAAEKRGVSVRTIERAHTNLNEPVI